MNPTRQHTLTKQDHAVIRSFILPIQLNIPMADNPKAVTTVLLMLACGMAEHVHFNTPLPQDATFESDDLGYGMELFQSIAKQGDIRAAAAAYLHYLTTGETGKGEATPYGGNISTPATTVTTSDGEVYTLQTENRPIQPKNGVFWKIMYRIYMWLKRNFEVPKK
jgi:hypothetical protein